jgi:hypothetical protein
MVFHRHVRRKLVAPLVEILPSRGRCGRRRIKHGSWNLDLTRDCKMTHAGARVAGYNPLRFTFILVSQETGGVAATLDGDISNGEHAHV